MSNGSRLIIFATHLEAKPTLASLKAQPIEENLYSYDRGLLVISGMGSTAAAIATTRYASQVDEIWNLGIAGALGTLDIGSILQVGHVAKYLPAPPNTHAHRLGQQAHPFLATAGGTHTLLTSDYPIWDTTLKQELAQNYGLIDMEGYGIAMAAQAHQKPCYIWKIVSDHATTKGWKELSSRLKELAEQLSCCCRFL